MISKNGNFERLKTEYEKNPDFKEYVDAFATSTRRTITDALECKMVADVYDYYVQKKADKIK